MCAYGQASVEEQDTAVGPWRQETSSVGWGIEGRVVFLERGINVLEGGRGGSGRTNGETETMGLIEVMIGVLPEDDCFDCGKRCMTGPVGSRRY